MTSQLASSRECAMMRATAAAWGAPVEHAKACSWIDLELLVRAVGAKGGGGEQGAHGGRGGEGRGGGGRGRGRGGGACR